MILRGFRYENGNLVEFHENKGVELHSRRQPDWLWPDLFFVAIYMMLALIMTSIKAKCGEGGSSLLNVSPIYVYFWQRQEFQSKFSTTPVVVNRVTLHKLHVMIFYIRNISSRAEGGGSVAGGQSNSYKKRSPATRNSDYYKKRQAILRPSPTQ